MMNGDEFMAVLLVTILATAATLRTMAKNGSFARRAGPDPEAARLRGEVNDLKQRIQVLERLITDTHQSASLDRQIDALRHR